MIYVENTSNYPQRVYIPRDEGNADDTRGYQFQKKDLDINHNGDYYLYPDPGYDGITASTIHVEVPTDTQEAYDQGYQDGYAAGYASGSTDGYASGHTDGYAEGYSSGHTDGYAEGYASGHTDGYAEGYAAGYEAGFAAGAAAQKAKLVPLTATTNGHYTTEDGYGDVYVNVEGGGDYSSGYTDGMAAQKALLTSTTFTDNGHFEREDGWNAIDVRLNLPSLHTAITENGRVVYLPPAGAKGFDSVEIDVQVPQSGTGATLTAITATTNGEYYPAQYSADGFSAVTVAVDTASTYQEGYEDGEAAQKAKLKELTATTNNHTYTDQDGYSAVTVSVDTSESYSSGVTDGMAAQKALLTSATITNNGTFTKENGWSGVTVNVPQSGYTQEDLDKAFNDGYRIAQEGCMGQLYISIYPERLVLDSNDLTQHLVHIYTNAGNPTVINNPSWCTVTMDNDKFFVAATENTGNTRAGTVTLQVESVDCIWDEETQQMICTTSTSETSLVVIQYGVGASDGDFSGEYLTFLITNDGNIKWGVSTSSTSSETIYYSVNGGAWVGIDSSANSSFNVSTGDSVRFKGNAYSFGYDGDLGRYNTFSGSTAEFIVYGNIMSLSNGDNFTGMTPMVSIGNFFGLFKSCENLIDASGLALPDMSLKLNCYAAMFSGCINLERPPKLPATNLGTQCYNSMFSGCTSLAYAPELPATELSSGCYRYMFSGCSKLEKAPLLPATRLVTECYYYMFENCTQLNQIECLATTKGETTSTFATSHWVDNVSLYGTFIKSPDVEFVWETGLNGIPSNWTVLNS